jgi:ferredoxin
LQLLKESCYIPNDTMQHNRTLSQIEKCVDCDACLEVCPTYIATKNPLFSPKGRLENANLNFYGIIFSSLERG